MTRPDQNNQSTTIMTIALASLRPHPLNPAERTTERATLELRTSMDCHGQITPLLVRPIPATKAVEGHWQIIAGHRRFAAAVALNMTKLTCSVREMSDEQAEELLLIENLQREEITPLDEAAALARLIEHALQDPHPKRSPLEAVGLTIGKSATYIAARLQLLQLIAPFQKLLKSGELPLGHAFALARIPELAQSEMFKEKRHLDHHGVISLAKLRDYIAREIMLDLDRAPFDKSDIALDPKAGSCMTCEKNTQTNKSLFGDLGKGARCTDERCFASKVRLHIEKTATKLAEKHKVDVMLISDRYQHEKPKAGQIMTSNHVFVVRARSEGAIIGLYVDGEKIGKHDWISLTQPKPADDARVPKNVAADREAQKESERAKKKKIAAMRAQRGAQVMALIEKVKKSAATGGALMQAMAISLVPEIHNDDAKAALRMLGLEASKPFNERDDLLKLTKTNSARAVEAMIAMLCARDLAVHPYNMDGKAERIIRFAEALKVDIRSIKAPAPAEKKVKKPEAKKPAAKKK